LMSIGEGSYGQVELVTCRAGNPDSGIPPAPVVIKKPKQGYIQVGISMGSRMDKLTSTCIAMATCT
jgi:hypothetical protein